MNEKIAALAAALQQLRTELGAFGVNMTPGAKASLAEAEDKLADLAAVLAPQPKAKGGN